MVQDALMNGKTVTGSVVLVAVTLLNAAGVVIPYESAVAVVGVAVTLAGWIHKLIKNRKK
jgi:hypothetical protein